jgi:predicted  nucleic acid-binding Zn-ribbon protein
MDFSHVRPDHLCHPIETIVEKHRKALQGCCDVLKEEQVMGEKSLEKVTDESKELKKEAEKAKGDISMQKEDIIKAVEDIFQRKIRKVEELYAVKEKQIVEQQNKVESFLDQVKRAGSLCI